MNEATKRAIERMRQAALKAGGEGELQRAKSNFERAERCEGQEHAFYMAITIIEEEHQKQEDAR